MKITITTFILTLLLSTAYSQDETVTLEIVVQNLENDKGKVYVGLYDSEQNWLSKRYTGQVSKIENGKAQITLENIPHGTYAISAFHDENDNNKLDADFFGIPKEPYACSNDATGFMGPPEWKDAKFKVKDSCETIVIVF